jgi:hypothetical protein
MRKYYVDSGLVLSLLAGTGLEFTAPPLPGDAEVIGARGFGTDVLLFVKSQEFETVTCLCNMPEIRVRTKSNGG